MSNNPSETAAQACAGTPPPTLSFDQLVAKNTALLSSLNLDKCRIDKSSGKGAVFSNSSPSGIAGDIYDMTNRLIESWWGSDIISGIGNLISGGGGGSSSSSSAPTSQSNEVVSGCSAANILLQNYNNAVEEVKCIINSDTTNSSITVNETTQITINVVGNFTDTCPVKQVIAGDIQLINNISGTCKTSIQNAIQNHIQNFTKQLSNVYKGNKSYGPNGQGTQNVNQINSSSTQKNVSNQISDTINNINSTVNSSDNYTLNVKGNVTFSEASGTCGNLDQEINLNIMANSIVANAFQSALQGVDLPSLMPPLPLPPAAPPKKSDTGMIVAIVLLILLSLGIAYYYFVYRKGHKPRNKFSY